MNKKRKMAPRASQSDIPYRFSGSCSIKAEREGTRPVRKSGQPNTSSSLGAPLARKIIVGVDFGTTCTGVSFVSSEGSGINDITIIGRWPGPTRETDYVMKTPSRIAYVKDGSSSSKQLWGFQVEPGMKACSWFKLLLDEYTPLTKYDDANLENASKSGILRLPSGKSATDVAADFLSEIYQCILKVLIKQITAEVLRITPLEFWFTVPAIWSDKAMNATLEAAHRAGFGKSRDRSHDTVNLIPEPEAAAITTLNKCIGKGVTASIEAGQGVMVCDCGGGTVDITTYLILEKSPTLALEEICTGAGAKCGSTAVDRNFYQLMSSRFGSDFENLPMKLKGPGSEFMKDFESVKKNFGLADGKTTYQLRLNMKSKGADPRYFDKHERLVTISKDDLRAVFDPVIDTILTLVRQQIRDACDEEKRDIIKRIILVSGFGDSEYLFDAFQEEFGPSQVAITVPDNPQAAIVAGAALRGLQGLQSTTRRCRRHYGYEVYRLFTPGIDNDHASSIHPVTGQKIAMGYMQWIIRKGDKYHEDDTRSISVDVDMEEGALRVTSELLACDLEVPPQRAESSDIYKIGTITSDFADVDLSAFRSNVHNQKRHYLSSGYSLNVTFGAREGILKFQGYCDGKEIGCSKIDYAESKF